jgi:hypothetical protein
MLDAFCWTSKDGVALTGVRVVALLCWRSGMRIGVRLMPEVAPTKQDQWQKLLVYVLGYQATWITDIGLKTGLFGAIADADQASMRTPWPPRLATPHAMCSCGAATPTSSSCWTGTNTAATDSRRSSARCC